eukprot:TRINITY_DN18239_c0_g1_i1.p1 TRINITY_DN18239_c0_g1~~TRINITY_DN18239_c0_g1_i1.p1  ORF type:complete len:345 (-),score=37.53 TRINITY_DN18239_c0_g1_i1:136-1170(-)
MEDHPAAGCVRLLSADDDVVQPRGQKKWLGVVFALLTSLCTVGMSAAAKFAGKGEITTYTSNFVASSVGAVVMAIMLCTRRRRFIPAFPNAQAWFFLYGCAVWFFMWGMFHSLRLMDMATWQSMAECLNQALIMLFASAMLGEKIDKFKVSVLLRNVVVIVLIAKPPFLFGGNASVPMLGIVFLIVQCTGASVGAIVQRRLCEQSTETLLFWGFAWNVFYWLPPGLNPPELRVPVLWPVTPQDLDHVTPSILACTVVSGAFNAFWYVSVGYGLKFMDAASLFFLIVPLSLGLSCITNAVVFGDSMDALRAVALTIIAFGFAFDRWYELRQERLRVVDETRSQNF